MKGTADLLRGIAALAWPIVVLLLAVVFRSEVSGMLKRVRKVMFPGGGGVEIDRSLDRLEASAETAVERSGAAPKPRVEAEAAPEVDEVEQTVLELAATSPTVALMTLAAEIDREMKELLSAVGETSIAGRTGLSTGVKVLARHTDLPHYLIMAIAQFSEVRNKIVHGHDADDRDVLRAIDSGLSILKTLRAVPRQRLIVVESGIDLYSDPDGTQVVPEFKGVLLKAVTPDGNVVFREVFPTTMSYRKDATVTWEWDNTKSCERSWYRDPDTGALSSSSWAWSPEFAGKDVALSRVVS